MDSYRYESKEVNIKAIDHSTVHKICSGQIVLNLAGIIKELVENSLDAKATTIDIRLKTYGKDLIEVIDNGCGVEEKNFQALTLNHHTSKLNDFSDLSNVDTFGFRGEALSSLCALSNLTIITCHESANIGSKLEFDHNGSLTKSTPCPRQKGTTVLLQNIFSTLPVRHKEFIRNLKRDFGKMVQLLYAYCIISENVRITCTNQIESGKKSVVVSTTGNNSIKENIMNIFGSKQISNLLGWEQSLPSSEVLVEFNIPHDTSPENVFRLNGFVSCCDHGEGRSANDRQFFFINQRPCDLPKVSKIINEVYHTYNRHQYPFVVLNINVEKNSVDVNVTPDKRVLFVENEKFLLAIIKTSLLKIYEKRVPSCPLQLTVSVSKKGFSETYKRTQETESSKKPSLLSRFKRSLSQIDGKAEILESLKKKKINHFIKKEVTSKSSPSLSSWFSSSNAEPYSESALLSQEKSSNNMQEKSNNTLSIFYINSTYNNSTAKIEECNENQTIMDHKNDISCNLTDDTCQGNSAKENINSFDNCNKDQTDVSHILASGNEVEKSVENSEEVKDETFQETFVLDEDISQNQKKSVNITWSKDNIKNYQNYNVTEEEIVRKFRAKISPNDNQTAEEELKKVLSKDMFLKMKILGQFNLGFIITLLDDDLFIIDQHATDEKYNFEQLQSTNILQSQNLIQPQDLELPAVSENIVIDNLDIFKKNGFEIQIDENAIPTKKLKLISIPVSYGWNCDKKDIEELIFMLADAPGIMTRPSRVWKMFASRACRKSIMIGTALNKSEMKTLVQHMSEIEQPWNCPHGRPTIRHLINLKMIASD